MSSTSQSDSVYIGMIVDELHRILEEGALAKSTYYPII